MYCWSREPEVQPRIYTDVEVVYSDTTTSLDQGSNTTSHFSSPSDPEKHSSQRHLDKFKNKFQVNQKLNIKGPR